MDRLLIGGAICVRGKMTMQGIFVTVVHVNSVKSHSMQTASIRMRNKSSCSLLWAQDLFDFFIFCFILHTFTLIFLHCPCSSGFIWKMNTDMISPTSFWMHQTQLREDLFIICRLEWREIATCNKHFQAGLHQNTETFWKSLLIDSGHRPTALLI